MTDNFKRENLPSIPKEDTNGTFKDGMLIENFNVSSTTSEREIPIKIFVPEKKDLTKSLIVQIHGGGWVKRGNAKVPSLLTKQGNIVVSIYYSLAPEHPFPNGINDCYDVMKWIYSKKHKLLKDIDLKKIVVLGDSAGGNLSAVMSYMIRDDPKMKYKLYKQVLVYPGVIFNGSTKSRIQYKNAYLLTQAKIDWFVKMYIQDVELFKKHPYGEILNIKDQTNLPETQIILARFDPLKDEGRMLGDLLAKNSVKVNIKEYPMIHGSYAVDFVKEGMNALNDSLDFINQ